MNSEVEVVRVTDGLQFALRTVAAFARRVAVAALVIGAATFATGLWIFDSGPGRTKWFVIGGLLCAVPFLAAATLAWRVWVTALRAPMLLDEVRRFTGRTGHSAEVLLDYDTGRRVGSTGARMGVLRAELDDHRGEYPAFAAAVRALATLPKLVAITIAGTLVVGFLGTILLIGGLID